MRIKKTLTFIMTAALTVGTMAGCSQSTINYSQELLNVAKWETTTSNIEGTMDFDALGKKHEVTFTADTYSSKNQSYVDIKFKDTAGIINVPELKKYVDGTTVYINKSYLEGIYTLKKQPIPEELSKISEEYIAFDSATIGKNTSYALKNQQDAMLKVGQELFGDNLTNIPFVQNGREYTVKLNSDQIIDLSVKSTQLVFDNLDTISNAFDLKLTPQDIDKVRHSYDSVDSDVTLRNLKSGLKGSTLAFKQSFTDTSFNGNFDINLKLPGGGGVSFIVNSTSVKGDVKAISIPANAFKIKQEDFNKISALSGGTVATTNAVVK